MDEHPLMDVEDYLLLDNASQTAKYEYLDSNLSLLAGGEQRSFYHCGKHHIRSASRAARQALHRLLFRYACQTLGVEVCSLVSSRTVESLVARPSIMDRLVAGRRGFSKSVMV